jgi:hypothetical protein
MMNEGGFSHAIFERCVGIEYSGPKTPTASLKGLRVYLAEGDPVPVEVPPPSLPKKYWTLMSGETRVKDAEQVAKATVWSLKIDP